MRLHLRHVIVRGCTVLVGLLSAGAVVATIDSHAQAQTASASGQSRMEQARTEGTRSGTEQRSRAGGQISGARAGDTPRFSMQPRETGAWRADGRDGAALSDAASQRLAECAGGTSGGAGTRTRYDQQPCDATEFMRGNPSRRPRYLIDETRDPVMQRSKPITANPQTVRAPGAGGQVCDVLERRTQAFEYNQCAVRPQSQTFRCERSLIVSVLDPGNECVPGQPMGVGAGSYGECSRQSGDDAWVGLGVRPFCVPQGEQRFWINGSGIWEHELGASGCGTGRPPNPRWLDPALRGAQAGTGTLNGIDDVVMASLVEVTVPETVAQDRVLVPRLCGYYRPAESSCRQIARLSVLAGSGCEGVQCRYRFQLDPLQVRCLGEQCTATDEGGTICTCAERRLVPEGEPRSVEIAYRREAVAATTRDSWASQCAGQAGAP